MSFECAKQFVSEMKSNKDLRDVISQIKKSGPMKNFMQDKGFDFNQCDLVQAMSSCMEEMTKNQCSAAKEASDKKGETSEKIKTLIAIGAATAANCIPCFEHMYFKAGVLSLTPTQIAEAVDIASKVKNGASMVIKDSINELMDGDKEPEVLKTVLAMYDSLGFTHKEIADILDITEKNSKVRLHRARQALKKILEEKCTFEVDKRNVLVCEPLTRTSDDDNQNV